MFSRNPRRTVAVVECFMVTRKWPGRRWEEKVAVTAETDRMTRIIWARYEC